jgi:hypothetical protein
VKHDGEWHEMKLALMKRRRCMACASIRVAGEGEVKIEGLTLKAADGKVLAQWP